MASSPVRGRANLALVCGFLSACGLGGCGGSAPTEAAIYHDPALRPGAVGPSSEEERELLSRLSTLPDGEAVHVGSFVLEPAYAAASGRRCRAVSTGHGRRLACEAPDGWVFVPEVWQGDGQEPAGAPE